MVRKLAEKSARIAIASYIERMGVLFVKVVDIVNVDKLNFVCIMDNICIFIC
jgi:hypothetical protein